MNLLKLCIASLFITPIAAYALDDSTSQFKVPKILPSAPGGQTTEQYRRWEDKDAALKLQTAIDNNESIIPRINTLKALPTIPTVPTQVNADPMAEANRKAALKKQLEQREQFINSLAQSKATALAKMFKTRAPEPHTIIESKFLKEDTNQVNPSVKTGNEDAILSDAIPAGEIFYAVMITEVNSDEPGPILAQVLNGRLKGARLLGEFKRNDESVSLSFKAVSYGKETSALSALAVDPATARTGIATDVNHHYISRYGALLAASFLEGFGEAIQQDGTSVVVNDFSVASESDFSTADQVAIGVGKVGEALGDAAKKNFDRHNTITVDSGTAIGVLIMAPLQAEWIPQGKPTGQSLFN